MTELPMSDPKYYELSVDEQIAECNAWLDNNPEAVRKAREAVRGQLRTIVASKKTETELATELAKRSLSSVRKEFPALMDRTISLPYFPIKHKHADIVPDGSRLRDVLPTIDDWMDNDFWGVLFAGVEHPDCDDEINAQQLIVSLLQSVLRALKLNTVIQVVQNRTLAGIECDVLLLYKPNRLPFAVIEAKKPGNSSESRRIVFQGKAPKEDEEEREKTGKRQKRERENRVAGEVLAEMMAIQLFGFPRVFGMISTGNHWRLVCTRPFSIEREAPNLKRKVAGARLKRLTGDTSQIEITKHELGNTGHLDDDMDNINQERSSENINVSPDQRRITFTNKHTQSMAAERIVYASEIFPDPQWDDKEKEVLGVVKKSGEGIVQMVTLFVLESCMTLIDMLEDKGRRTDELVIRPRMACRILTPKEQVFAFGTAKQKELKLLNFDPALQKIHVIHHLGTGEHGSCCLGISADGLSACAVKFFHKAQKEQAQLEFRHWRQVYGSQKVLPMSRILENAGGDCLVMPYLRPIGEEKRHQFLTNGRIRKALVEFAKSRYIHNDIKWRHFGLWGAEVFLLDLGDIEPVKNQDEINTWLNNAMEYLRQSAGKVKTPARHYDGHLQKRKVLTPSPSKTTNARSATNTLTPPRNPTGNA